MTLLKKEKPIIEIKHLSKQYNIGMDTTYKTFSESFTSALKHPIKTLKDFHGQNETFWALKDVSFEVERGEAVGIIGRNGAGKSTLLKILSRITYPTEGEIRMYGKVGSLLEIGTGFHPELTGRENIYFNGAILGMKKKEIDGRFDKIVEFAGVEKFLDTPVKRYSSGMQVRLAFSVAAHLDPEILIVDEVLAVGDAEFQKKCLGKMKDISEGGRTVLFVSHNMAAINNLCDRAVLLNKGEVQHLGSVEEVTHHYFTEEVFNEKVFNNSILKRAKIQQLGEYIELVVEYDFKDKACIPFLGFVINDNFGNHVFGLNPSNDKIKHDVTPRKSGHIKVILKYPKLLNGIYSISLWFGDGVVDCFCELDCLTFEVIDMVKPLKEPQSSSVGCVFPECEWVYE
jgi:ABC-type polysaccharide/polyol phosphate transport system ATPase subunit